jgi:hypothetical protein
MPTVLSLLPSKTGNYLAKCLAGKHVRNICGNVHYVVDVAVTDLAGAELITADVWIGWLSRAFKNIQMNN